LALLSLGLPSALSQSQGASVRSAADPPPGQLNGKPCLSIDDARSRPGKDICVAAHVFDVVELSDGTRFLDVCPPDVPDEKCHFTFVSLRTDRETVGDLTRYRDQNVHVRGIIRATHGRTGMVISDIRQFRGGPEKFRPNPRLARGFDAQSDRPPVRDPNLSSGGRHRSFMNSRDTESLSARSVH
jgi:hypothetical protein